MKSILVVEPESSLQRVVARLLSEVRYAVITASSGEEALNPLEEKEGASHPWPIDLILCDWELTPAMKGRALATAVRQKPGYHSTPFIFMTGWGLNRVQLEQPAIEVVILKPFGMSELLELINHLLVDAARVGERSGKDR